MAELRNCWRMRVRLPTRERRNDIIMQTMPCAYVEDCNHNNGIILFDVIRFYSLCICALLEFTLILIEIFLKKTNEKDYSSKC